MTRSTKHEARLRLTALGEDPDEYRFHGGSGGLITPYEDDPEAITPEEHNQIKSNLRQQWIGGKMNAEDYRRKTAEIPLPSKASQKPAAPAEGAKGESKAVVSSSIGAVRNEPDSTESERTESAKTGKKRKGSSIQQRIDEQSSPATDLTAPKPAPEPSLPRRKNLRNRPRKSRLLRLTNRYQKRNLPKLPLTPLRR